MCELVISVLDVTAAEPAVEAHMVKRGVVIEVFEDDHAYGRMELTHPMFRIIRLPGVPMAFGRGFLGGEPGDPKVNPLLLGRQFRLDIANASVPADLKAYLADDSRAAGAYTVNLASWPLSAITALKAKRPSLPTPAIGQPANVIG